MDRTEHSRIYEALKAYGFSPPKASEIALDAKRGDLYALAFVDLAQRALPAEFRA